MKRVLALLCSLTVLCAALLVGVPTAQAAVDGTVRVWLKSMNEYGTIQSVSITLDGSYSIPTAPEVSLSTRGTYYIENVDGTLMISGTGIDGQVAVGTKFTVKQHKNDDGSIGTISLYNNRYGNRSYRGDMLFDPSGASKAIRVQGAFISDDEVMDLVDFVKEKAAARYDESVIEALDRADAADKKQKDEEKEEEDTDPLLMDCVELAVDAGQISASMIQRKYRVGYARAGRILDQMEKRGFISGFEGSKPRQTRITREQFYQLAGVEPNAPAYHDDEE